MAESVSLCNMLPIDTPTDITIRMWRWMAAGGCGYMFSLTGEYALRAMIYLAQHEAQWPIPGKRIAAQSGIPAKYLSKILGDLVRAGVLRGTRGLGGGFRMVQGPRTTTLFDVLKPFETFTQQRCPFGNKECSDSDPCLAHDQWKKVLEAQLRFLQRTSVSDAAIKKRSAPRRSSRAAQC